MEKMDTDIVCVAKVECLSCIHLVGKNLGSSSQDCLTDFNCPAKYYRIALGGDINNAAERLAGIMKDPNPDEMETLLTQFKTMDASVVEVIKDKAKILVQE